MLTRAQLVKNKPLLVSLHSAKNKKAAIKVIQQCHGVQLRLLIKLIYDVMCNKIDLGTPSHVKRLFRFKDQLRNITNNVRKLLKEPQDLQRSLLGALTPVLRLFLDPLFPAVTHTSQGNETTRPQADKPLINGQKT